MNNKGYSNSQEGLKDLREAYDAWSGKLTDYSLYMSYALIAAIWAVHGKDALQLTSTKLSLALIIVFLAVNLILTFCLSNQIRSRYSSGENDPATWEKEFERYKNDPGYNPWPYTLSIDEIAKQHRCAKLWLPLISGLLFLSSLFKLF